MDKDFESVQGRILTNLILGTVMGTLVFLFVMRRVILDDPPISELMFWLSVGIVAVAVITLVRVNLLRKDGKQSVRVILAMSLVLVGFLNWFAPDPSRVM